MEVLFREGNFGSNFVRGLGIILFWMSLLAALGLAAASFLSFPVAAFFSVALLVITFSSGTLSNVVSEGTVMGYDEEKGTKGHSAVDNVVVPAFRGLLDLINLVQGFSPIDSLSTGRRITWAELGLAVFPDRPAPRRPARVVWHSRVQPPRTGHGPGNELICRPNFTSSSLRCWRRSCWWASRSRRTRWCGTVKRSGSANTRN